MNATKLIIGTIAGTIFVFALDYLAYGVLLKDVLKMAEGCEKWPDMMFLILGLLIIMLGFTMMYLKGAESGSKVQQGLRFGLIFALAFAIGMNFIWYSVTTTHELSYYYIDDAYGIVRWSLAGIVVAYATGVPGDGDRGKSAGGGSDV